MKVIENGDLIRGLKDGEVNVIVHGCNCFHSMGAGIAYKIAKEWPEALEADKSQTKWGDFGKLSDFSSTRPEFGNRTIINLYTQYYFGADLYLGALYFGWEKLCREVFRDVEGLKVGIPAIGCGIGGGNHRIILPQLKLTAQRFGVDLTYYDYNNLIDTNNIIQ